MGYKRQEILEKCTEALSMDEPFYQNKMINYRGKTTDTDEYYTEIICEFICRHLNELTRRIHKITRRKSYRTETHTGEFSPNSNRKEEIIAMKLFKQSRDKGTFFPYIGKIIDYQTPLKSESGDDAGKIDLLSYDGKTLHILELKKPDSKETMLRCMLEGYTYLHTVDQKKLICDFGLPGNTLLQANPLVFYGGIQYDENQENRIWLTKFAQKTNSIPVYLTEQNGIYSVKEGEPHEEANR